MKQTLSAVIMSFNSADLIEGTLKSVSGWVDEIIVIDGFSTDNTVAVCERYGAKVFQHKWSGYRFCEERNLGIEKSTSDWCLHIDPDERATPEFKNAALELLSSEPKHNAYEFHKRNFFMGHKMRFGGWYHYSLHFFKRDKAKYEGIIHENLKVDGSIGRIEACIEHHPYPSIMHFASRHNNYSSREAAMLLEENKSMSEADILYNLKKKPLKRFWKFYFKKLAILDGRPGLVFSVLYAWVHFLNWVKYWELTRIKNNQVATEYAAPKAPVSANS